MTITCRLFSALNRRSRSIFLPFLLLASILTGHPLPKGALVAQEAPRPEGPRAVHQLTLENMVNLTMSNSYTVRRLNLEVERDRHNLRAERARLRSSADLELTIPAFRLTSEPKWNSDLQKDQIIQENTRRWEGELSIRQPVVLFGYPTNGYLSINNRMYRYNQIDDEGDSYVSYYNRYYISYTQPLFQPNSLKNSLEQAELNLEDTQLDFNRDIINIVSGVSDGYHSLFSQYYRKTLRQEMVADLERALGIAQDLAQRDSARVIDIDQIQVELANAREQLQSTESSIRLSESFVKREYGFAEDDSLVFDPVFQLDPIPIDMDDAVRYAQSLTPRMRQMDIDLRSQEIRLDRTKSRGGFRMDLSMSYGRERRDEIFDHIWVDPDNSYTVNVRTFLPVWDWGGRKAMIQSSEIGIEQTLLRMEQTELEIVSSVRNEVLNVLDRESRTLAMRTNLELARGVSDSSFLRYREGAISALDLLLGLRRKTDTAENFVDAYVSWKGSLNRLQRETYYNFERDRPVLDWFRDEGWVPENGFGGPLP